MLRTEVKIINKLGMHARAAAKFVTLAQTFSAEIKIEKNGQEVNGKSIMGVMMLAAEMGSELLVEVDGEDEQEALADLVRVIETGFGEET